MKTDEVVVVDVDLGIAPQCEHSRHHEPDWHGGDAKYVVAGVCPECGPVKRILLCGPAWREFERARTLVYCTECGADGVALRIVSVL